MKITIVLCCVLTLGACRTLKIIRNGYPSDFVDMVRSYGYSATPYDVQTEDGYILTLFRISKQIRDSDEKADEAASSSSEEDSRRLVFLMHGLMTDSESFIYGGPTESLALRLVDSGYDVFLGNARGTPYGQRHTTLDPKKDAAFWRFCWHEIGTRDLPALLGKALSVSGRNSISYIGHNEGTTSFYVMISENPNYSSKFDMQISLGPIAFMKNSNEEVLENIENHYTSKSWIMKNLGMNSFAPTHELVEDAETNCLNNHYDENICKNTYFLFNGYNSKHLNQTTVNQLISRVPSTASVREILHFAQLKKSGRFSKFSDDDEAEEYDLSKVDIPVALFYTPSDPLSTVGDVKILAGELPNVFKQHNFDQMSNNLDLLWSKNVKDVVREVIGTLQENPAESS